MSPVTDEPIPPEEDGEPLPPVGHVRVVYLGPVAPTGRCSPTTATPH